VIKREKNLRAALIKKLTKKEQEFLRKSYDVIGGIAILEIPEELLAKEKTIAEYLLAMRPSITTVLKKSGIHGGEFRTQKLSWLAGIKTKEATYKENDVALTLNVETVYFSVRLAHERRRIVELVKPKENILVLFSGCAPYPVVLARNTKAQTILGIESNPEGHKYGLVNIKQNKLKNVSLQCSDVKKVKMRKTFDRILMPLPKSAADYLIETLKWTKKGTNILFYAFEKKAAFSTLAKQIAVKCKLLGKPCKILRTVACGKHAPYVYRVCIDLKIQ